MKSESDSRMTRAGLAAAVFALGVALSLTAFTNARANEREARRIEFERRASQVAHTARMSFDVPLEVLRSIPALFEASAEVTRGEFRRFVRDALQRYPSIYALEWIPRVPHEERARFEAAAVADGLAGYHFKQDAANGPVLAEERPVYFPLYYMEPLNTTALGIEETALPARKIALERARDLGTTITTERLKLVQDDPSVFSVIAFHPVYERGEDPLSVEARRRSLRGFAAAVFRVTTVVASGLRDTDLGGLDVVLVDTDAPPSRALLYESRPEAAQEGRAARHEHSAVIAGRRWTFRISDRAGTVAAGAAGWSWLGSGLLASTLAAAFTYALFTVLRLRRQVSAARRLGQYTLVERIGEGGMGTVYRAHHALLRRPTAIKLLHPARARSNALARFEREVQLTSALTHPNTVVVYDYGHTHDGVFYYAMEYIDGITLQELVDVCGLQPPERVVSILSQICGALAEAHALDLVHRDIKPANVMLCKRGDLFDFVKVLDFGLAKDLSDEASTRLSQSSTVLGTPLYVAPEAIGGGSPVDARTDIYALGAVGYFLLSGAPVFTGSSVVEICAQHLSVPPEPLSRRLGQRSVGRDLEELVMRCLAKDPKDRPTSASELCQALSVLTIQPWSTNEARLWWQEHGKSLEERVRAARGAREKPSTSVTVELNPRRHELPDAVHRA